MPRLEHKKSRRGCRRCRDRKVKCDEQKPICGACAKHDVECRYQENYVFSNSNTQTLSVSSKSSQNEPSPAPMPQRDRLLELRLMHYYTAEAYTSLFFAGVVDVARDYLPELSIQNEFLLDALMSFSALHMHKYNSHDGDRYFWEVHRSYFERAITGHRTAVGLVVDSDPESTQRVEKKDPHFLAMAMIGTQTFLLLSEERGPYELPMLWLQYMSGLKGIAAHFEPFAGWSGRLLPFLADAKVHLDDTMTEEAAKMMIELNRAWGQCDVGEESQREACLQMLQCLGAAHLAMTKGTAPALICRKLFMTPTIVNRSFLELIATGNHQAIAMLGHLFVMFEKVEHAYPWFKGIAVRQVRGIEKLLPADWQIVMHTMPRQS